MRLFLKNVSKRQQILSLPPTFTRMRTASAVKYPSVWPYGPRERMPSVSTPASYPPATAVWTRTAWSSPRRNLRRNTPTLYRALYYHRHQLPRAHRPGHATAGQQGRRTALYRPPPLPSRIEGHPCINTEAAATGELICHLIESLGITLDHKLALPLYTSILIDTNSFRYPTVTPEPTG